jgi:hypothetical protein
MEHDTQPGKEDERMSNQFTTRRLLAEDIETTKPHIESVPVSDKSISHDILERLHTRNSLQVPTKRPEFYRTEETPVKSRGINTCARINALLHSSSVVLVTHMNGGQQIVKEVQSHGADWKKVTLLCEDGIERVIYSPWFTPLGELFLGLP